MSNRTDQPGELAEAARQLRAVLAAAPPNSASERATARRIEGAATALDALSGCPAIAQLADDQE